MGRIRDEIEFDYPAPSTDQLVETISEYAGLPVSIISTHADMHNDVYVTLAFTAFPNDTLDIVYKNRSISKQSLIIKGFLGQEPSLYFAVESTLRTLRGKSLLPDNDSEYLTDDLDLKYTFPVTYKEMELRHKNNIRQNKQGIILTIIFMPFTILFSVLSIPFEMIKLVCIDPDQLYDKNKNILYKIGRIALFILILPIAMLYAIVWLPFNFLQLFFSKEPD